MRSIFLLPLLVTIGCSHSESPHEVYERYVQLEISGITVEQFIGSYTRRKQLEIESAVKDAMSKNGLSREETIKSYLPVFQRFAKCKDLDFLDEDIEGENATIFYKSTDDCTEGQLNVKKEIIYMVYEDGSWKIDNNDIQEL